MRGHALEVDPLQQMWLGNTMRHFREKAGLTRTGLAQASELSTVMIGKIEQGTRMPSREKFRVLCGALGVSPERFLNTADQLRMEEGWRILTGSHSWTSGGRSTPDETEKEDQMGVGTDYHLSSIAQALNRIANCLEANERRARETEKTPEKPSDPELVAAASYVLTTYEWPTDPNNIARMSNAIAAVRRGFDDLERDAGKEPDAPDH